MKLPHLFAQPRHAGFHSRRDFLRRTGAGAGMIGLASLLADSGLFGSTAQAAATAASLNPLAVNGLQMVMVPNRAPSAMSSLMKTVQPFWAAEARSTASQ